MSDQKRPRVYVGLVGMPAAGKGTFTENIKECAAQHGLSVGSVRFSDALLDVCDEFGLPKTRKVLQRLSTSMKTLAPESTPVATAARNRAMKLKEDIVIFDGVRWIEDEEMLRGLSNSFLVYITADQRTRWERSRERGEKIEESGTTFVEFVENDNAPTEVCIPEIGLRADIVIDNGGDMGMFQAVADGFFYDSVLDIFK